MGFLHKLWDETLAGPPPESGLGKLRKFNSLNSPVLRTNHCLRNLTVDTSVGSLPDSPVSSVSSPLTPGTPQGDQIQRLTWRKSSAETAERVVAEPRTPTVYDWVVISALDR